MMVSVEAVEIVDEIVVVKNETRKENDSSSYLQLVVKVVEHKIAFPRSMWCAFFCLCLSGKKSFSFS